MLSVILYLISELPAYLHIAVLSPDITGDQRGVWAALQPRPAAGLGHPQPRPRARVESDIVLPDLPGLRHLDSLDAAALEPGLSPVPGLGDGWMFY